MTLEVAWVDWLDPRAVALRTAMDAETGPLYAPLVAGMPRSVLDAIDRAFAVDPEQIAATILVLDGEEPVGHSALRPVSAGSTTGTLGSTTGILEVKKVFVPKPHRGRGISKLLMSALEDIARERGAGELVLQTGSLQTEAIALYEQIGYERIPVFGAYTTVPFALCFRKALS